MDHGGRRHGAGRPEGARNRRTVDREAEAAKAAAMIEATLGEPFTGDAHALLMTVYKDPSLPMGLRIDAAKAAIRFEKPVLAAIDMNTVGENVTYVVSSEPMTQEEWEAKHCRPPETEH